MHSRYWREQPGVAEQSDADDRLRSALENQFHSSFTEHMENTITNYVFMILYRNMCVARMVGEETFFQKRVCESLDERYLFDTFLFYFSRYQ
jgi:hypothetical protein